MVWQARTAKRMSPNATIDVAPSGIRMCTCAYGFVSCVVCGVCVCARLVIAVLRYAQFNSVLPPF